MRLLVALPLFLISALSLDAQRRPQPELWRSVLEERLPYYGHRNWIVIADSAYPLQSAPGIETILSNESQVETVRHTLALLAKTSHVRPVVYTDHELSFVPEADATGITAYRQLLGGVFEGALPGQQIFTLPHEDIIHKLDQASQIFHVLIIKTKMALPYTSVFLELRAAYWGDEPEQHLRTLIK
jgi:hypothetical protein